MTTMLLRAACAASLLLFCSCETSRFYEHRFQPAPLEAEVSTQAVPGAQVRALVTVLGIERGRDGAKDCAVVRMRLENLGSVQAKLDAETLSLVTADLKSFGQATVAPGQAGPGEGREVKPGENAVFDIEFPLPQGQGPYDLNLSGLNLRFTVVFGEQRVTTGASFQRTDWRYYEQGYPRVHVGLGFGWTRCN